MVISKFDNQSLKTLQILSSSFEKIIESLFGFSFKYFSSLQKLSFLLLLKARPPNPEITAI